MRLPWGHPAQVQDIRFAVSQLAEIAARALSPGFNDPDTAVMCIDRWNPGVVRIPAKAPTLAHVLHAAYSQIRRYGRRDAQVLTRLLESLGEIASWRPCPGRAATARRPGSPKAATA